MGTSDFSHNVIHHGTVERTQQNDSITQHSDSISHQPLPKGMMLETLLSHDAFLSHPSLAALTFPLCWPTLTLSISAQMPSKEKGVHVGAVVYMMWAWLHVFRCPLRLSLTTNSPPFSSLLTPMLTDSPPFGPFSYEFGRRDDLPKRLKTVFREGLALLLNAAGQATAGPPVVSSGVIVTRVRFFTRCHFANLWLRAMVLTILISFISTQVWKCEGTLITPLLR
jgi:hypothetical protein